MYSIRRVGCWLLAAGLLTVLGNLAGAQETPLPEDPAVAAILETKPITPFECIRAAKILSDRKRPDLAKQYLQKVIDAKLDQEALENLAQQYGSTIFVQLSARGDLYPESKQVADAVLGARKAELQDPKRLEDLIKKLQDPSAEKRGAAIASLIEAREVAVTTMIEVLADPARAAEYPQVRAALVAMGQDSVEPLLAIFDQADVKLKVQAIAVLGQLKAPRVQLFLFQPYFSESNDAAVRAAAGAALKQLIGTLPSKSRALQILMDNAKNYFDLRQPMPGAIQGKVEEWYWDEARRKCAMTMIPADNAARNLAARLSQDAFILAPQDAVVRKLYIASMLEAAAYQKDLSNPLNEKDDAAVVEAKQLGAKAVEEAMAYAMASGHPASAAAAADILGRIGKAEDLLYEGSQPGTLAQALRYPDRRLRMSAVRAIMALTPQRPYAGSSYLLQAVIFFASSSSMPRALLAGANVEDLRRMIPVLSAAGIHADLAVNGQEVTRMAVASPDYELAMIDAGVDRPTIELLLQQLRHDERSADLRVGLIARDGFFERAEHAAQQDQLVKTFARPHDDVSVRWQLEQLTTLKPQEFVGFKERQQQAAEALDILTELSRTSGKLYDMRRAEDAVLTALNNPLLSRKAIAVMAGMNSPQAQRALVELASRETESLENRQAALSAFRENTQAHGILLITEEIQRQYQRHNENKDRDPASQKIFALILDCLEAPTGTGK